MKELFVGALALGLLFTPLDDRIKLMVAAVGFVPGAVGTAQGLKRYSDARSRYEDLLDSTERLTRASVNDISSAKAEAQKILDAANKQSRETARKAEEERSQLLIDIAEQKAEISRIKTELEQEKDKFKAERAKLYQDLVSLSELQAEVQFEREKILAQARAEASVVLAQEKAKLTEQTSAIATMEAEIKAQIERLKLEWEGQKQADQLKLAQDKQRWELELQQARDEFEQECSDRIQAIDTEGRKKLKALQEKAWQDFEKESESAIEAEVQERLKPYIQKINQLQKSLEVVQQRLVMANERYERTQRPNVPRGHHPRESMARDLCMFYFEKAGIILDVVTSYIFPDNSVRVVLADKDPSHPTTIEELKKHKNSLQMHLQLVEAPVPTVAAEGYEFLLRPQERIYLGMPTTVQDPVAIFAYNPPEIRLENSETIAEFNAVSELQQAEKKQRMLTYIPPEHPLPTQGEITQAEIEYVEWLYNWRYEAEGKPNVRNQNDLIEMVWHVKPGYGSDRKSVAGMTIRKRLHAIFDLLRIEYTSKS